jgi:hypothetical protein
MVGVLLNLPQKIIIGVRENSNPLIELHSKDDQDQSNREESDPSSELNGILFRCGCSFCNDQKNKSRNCTKNSAKRNYCKCFHYRKSGLKLLSNYNYSLKKVIGTLLRKRTVC